MHFQYGWTNGYEVMHKRLLLTVVARKQTCSKDAFNRLPRRTYSVSGASDPGALPVDQSCSTQLLDMLAFGPLGHHFGPPDSKLKSRESPLFEDLHFRLSSQRLQMHPTGYRVMAAPHVSICRMKITLQNQATFGGLQACANAGSRISSTKTKSVI